jgi:hypothetical protein
MKEFSVNKNWFQKSEPKILPPHIIQSNMSLQTKATILMTISEINLVNDLLINMMDLSAT